MHVYVQVGMLLYIFGHNCRLLDRERNLVDCVLGINLITRIMYLKEPVPVCMPVWTHQQDLHYPKSLKQIHAPAL